MIASAAVLVACCCAPPAWAVDGAALGTVWAEAGTTAVLPIVVLDASGNALGRDAGDGRRIQGISIGARLSDPSLVTSVKFTRDGITGSLTPIFETQLEDSAGSTVSWVVTFDESASGLPFTLDVGDVIGVMEVGISSQATPGSELQVQLEPTGSAIANQGGWITSTGATGLFLENGLVRVEAPALFTDGFESGNTSRWTSALP